MDSDKFRFLGRTALRISQCKPAFLVGLMLFLLHGFAAAGEINACKYLLVRDFSNDPYGIANELRTQGSERGFVVALSTSDVEASERLKMCVMSGSWSANGYGGRLNMQVTDASGSLLAEVAAGATAWVNARRTVRTAVRKIYSQLGYTGFNEDVFERRLQREYPKRPTVAISEDAIKNSKPKNPVEGIWTEAGGHYRLGIVPASQGTGADFLLVVLQSDSPLWERGEIKGEIRSTASPNVFTCTYFMQNKKAQGTTLTLEHNTLLRSSALTTPVGATNLVLARVWPTVSEETATSEPQQKSVSSGTGFLLNRSGLIATNWHVVADAKNISVAFPGWNGGVTAEVVIRDKVNDLAILRLTDTSKLETTCRELPFQLASARGITLGERVSTVGYPLTPMLGSNPKFAEGAVSSKTGFQDDPRWVQISAQVEPGSSGSPLFDSDGNIIGVVVATLDAARVFQAASVIPQNVNFAIKSDYLLSLFALIPGDSLGSQTTTFSPEKAAQCIAIIRAW